MKILAVNERKETCIVEMHKNEFANLVNLYSRYDDKFKEFFVLDKEIEVSKLYTDVRELNSLLIKLEESKETILEPLLKYKDFISTLNIIKGTKNEKETT